MRRKKFEKLVTTRTFDRRKAKGSRRDMYMYGMSA